MMEPVTIASSIQRGLVLRGVLHRSDLHNHSTEWVCRLVARSGG